MVWGNDPPGKLFQIRCFEIASKATFEPKYFISVLPVVTAASETQLNQAAWNDRLTGALFPSSRHRNEVLVGWKAWSGLVFKVYRLATLNFVHISPTPNLILLGLNLVPKCRAEIQESLSPLIVTLDTLSLEKSREASSYFGRLELQQNFGRGYM